MSKKIKRESLEKILSFTQRLSSTLELPDILEIIMEAAKELTHSEASSLMLYDEKIKKLKFTITTGEAKDRVKEITVPIGEGSIAGSVFINKKPVIVNDVRKDTRWFSKVDEKTQFRTKSILAVPLLLHNRCIGVIEVLNKTDNIYTEEDVNLLTILSEQAANVINNAEKYRELLRWQAQIKQQESIKYRLVGKSKKLREAMELARKVAQSPTTVLIIGESGTGKELLARYIHEMSSRKDAPFTVVNCAAIPATLIESELFGYEKGAFTGATTRKPGKVELSHKGTLFLDEIGDVDLETQVKLLRFLEEREFQRLGGKETITVDVRIITATNQNLEELIAQRKLREDLYYRLSVFPIELPPLRERKEDIPLLVEHFIKMFNRETTKKVEGVEEDVINILMDYNWPGNIRELRNVIERAFVLTQGGLIKKEHIIIRPKPTEESIMEVYHGMAWEDAVHLFKKSYLQYLLKKYNYDHKRVAEILGILPSYLSRLKRELGVK